jgi:aminoglycoside phosphotransferase (APT) family kinase protein
LESQTVPDEKSLRTDQIADLCRRGFGPGISIESIHSLGGGTFNTAYLITFKDKQKVVLRVAPPESPDAYWDETLLMRREHSMQPFFAPVATLMPKTLLVDFTHQLIDRDYMFQTFIEGEGWEDVAEELSGVENNILWSQFGGITRLIHNVQGREFGLSLPGFQFPSWSLAVMDRLERTLQAAQKIQLEMEHLRSILDMVRSHPEQLDEIQVPRLLHGDLWLFNILIKRGETGPSIVGILDADRSWWGDPMADWTMFILAHAEKEVGHSHFWQAYGRLEDTPGAKFRKEVYDAMHAGTVLIWALQRHDDETVGRAKDTLSEVASSLSAQLRGQH